MSAEPTAGPNSGVNGAGGANAGMPAPQFPIEADRPIRLSDDLLMSPRDLPIGGQAVLEGVMMRGVSTWAVAVRLPHDRDVGNIPDGRTRLPEGWRLAPPENGSDQVTDHEGNQLGGIEVHKEPFVSSIKTRRSFKLPVLRGVVALVESMKIGMKALMIFSGSPR